MISDISNKRLINLLLFITLPYKDSAPEGRVTTILVVAFVSTLVKLLFVQLSLIGPYKPSLMVSFPSGSILITYSCEISITI